MQVFHRNKNRINEIDFLRGILILFMIVDHFFYDLWDILPELFSDYLTRCGGLYNFAIKYWNWDVRVGTRFAILALFFLLSGISCYFSKNNLKRGLIVFTVGLLINVGFYGFAKLTGNNTIMIFGAISCFGTSILIYFLIKLLFDKMCPKYKEDFKWIALSLGLMIIAFGMTFGVWNVKTRGPDYTEVKSFKSLLQIMIGMKQHSGPDWLPLCPYLGLMFVGSFIGETIYKDRKSLFPKLPSRPDKSTSTLSKVNYYGLVMPYKGINKVIAFTGRHSLLFYLGHQVILILGLALVFLALGFKLTL